MSAPHGLRLAFDSSGGTKIRSFPWTPSPPSSYATQTMFQLPRSPKCPWRPGDVLLMPFVVFALACLPRSPAPRSQARVIAAPPATYYNLRV
ncbi:hypothetical protein K438DRAFT_2000787 [Mycena galopus ATCC 62051]|nr:hypothetical protein K438DRAFT_2000787 [Mycena galopus ATCC 62051]